MPISQSRIIALISAAREYEQLFTRLCSGAQALAAEHDSGQIDSAMQLRELGDLINSLRPTTEAVQAITSEAVHFKLTARRNELNKARQRRRRAGFVMSEGNKLSLENEAALAEKTPGTSPESIIPQIEQTREYRPQAMRYIDPAITQRYSAPTKADLEQAAQESFKARSEAIRQSLRDGTFVESMLKPSDPSIVEVETVPDPEGYDTEAGAELGSEDF